MRNYIRQKEGEIEAYKTLEIDAQKWCKEHTPRNGNDLTEQGQILLEENVRINYALFPVEFLAKQDHQQQGIRQM